MTTPLTTVPAYDHAAANVHLRTEIVTMHRVVDSYRHRLSQAEALAEALREDLVDSEKELARLRSLIRGMYDELTRDEGSMNGVNNVCELLAAEVER